MTQHPRPEGDRIDSPPSSRIRRRWYQFSLWSLFALAVLVALVFGAWRWYTEPYRAQRQTIALIERLGGSYEAAEPRSDFYGQILIDAPSVTFVNLADCDTPDEFIGAISRLPYLQTLVVGGLTFTDEYLAVLADLRTLRHLVLDSTSVSDAAVAVLQEQHPTLRILHSERRAIAAIHASGGSGGLSGRDPEFAGLRPLLADAFAWKESSATVTDDGLRYVPCLKGLRALVLSGRFTTDGLQNLERTQKLEDLNMASTSINDADLAQLAAMPGLAGVKRLSLDGTWITDAALDHVAKFRELTLLNLSRNEITDVGMQSLYPLTHLQALSLDETQVTDAGIKQLAGLKHLRELRLCKTPISDEAILSVARLGNIDQLAVAETKITDTAVEHLTRLKLTSLWIRDTQISASGVARLQRALPKCKIQHPLAVDRSAPAYPWAKRPPR